MTKEKEEWKDIEGWEGFYKVSNLGRVKRVERERCAHCGNPGNKELILQDYKGIKARYKAVSLSKPGMGRISRTFTVHRLVAKHFVPGQSKEKNVVNHIDGDSHNNRASNLEWTNHSENNKHAFRIGRKKIYGYYNPWKKEYVRYDEPRPSSTRL